MKKLESEEECQRNIITLRERVSFTVYRVEQQSADRNVVTIPLLSKAFRPSTAPVRLLPNETQCSSVVVDSGGNVVRLQQVKRARSAGRRDPFSVAETHQERFLIMSPPTTVERTEQNLELIQFLKRAPDCDKPPTSRLTWSRYRFAPRWAEIPPKELILTEEQVYQARIIKTQLTSLFYKASQEVANLTTIFLKDSNKLITQHRSHLRHAASITIQKNIKRRIAVVMYNRKTIARHVCSRVAHGYRSRRLVAKLKMRCQGNAAFDVLFRVSKGYVDRSSVCELFKQKQQRKVIFNRIVIVQAFARSHADQVRCLLMRQKNTSAAVIQRSYRSYLSRLLLTSKREQHQEQESKSLTTKLFRMDMRILENHERYSIENDFLLTLRILSQSYFAVVDLVGQILILKKPFQQINEIPTTILQHRCGRLHLEVQEEISYQKLFSQKLTLRWKCRTLPKEATRHHLVTHCRPAEELLQRLKHLHVSNRPVLKTVSSSLELSCASVNLKNRKSLVDLMSDQERRNDNTNPVLLSSGDMSLQRSEMDITGEEISEKQIYEKRIAAATAIQTTYRTHLARNLYQCKVIAADSKKQIVIMHVKILQQHGRAFICRQSLPLKIKIKKMNEMTISRSKAATKIQKWWSRKVMLVVNPDSLQFLSQRCQFLQRKQLIREHFASHFNLEIFLLRELWVIASPYIKIISKLVLSFHRRSLIANRQQQRYYLSQRHSCPTFLKLFKNEYRERESITSAAGYQIDRINQLIVHTDDRYSSILLR